MDKGDSFVMGVLKTKVRKKHLWIVLSDIKKHNGFGVIVNISTDKDRTRQECPLACGEHPWLDEPISWVCYGDATLMTPSGWSTIETGIKNGFIIPQEICPQTCLDKIISEAKISAAKPNGAFRRQLLPYLE